MNKPTMTAILLQLQEQMDALAVTCQQVALMLPQYEKLSPQNSKVGRIIRCVASDFEVSESEIIARRRPERIVLARHVCFYFASKGGFNNCEIGRLMGDRDSGTVLHGIRHVRAKMEVELKFLEQIEKLETKLKNAEWPLPEVTVERNQK